MVSQTHKYHTKYHISEAKKTVIRNKAHAALLSHSAMRARLGMAPITDHYKAFHGHAYGSTTTSEDDGERGGTTGAIIGLFKGMMY